MEEDTVEFIIEDAAASLEMEGFEVTEGDKELVRRCFRGELSFDEAVQLIIDRYRDDRTRPPLGPDGDST